MKIQEVPVRQQFLALGAESADGPTRQEKNGRGGGPARRIMNAAYVFIFYFL
jgi:hypothetical protein